jgi:hypothetical protein
VIEQIEVRTETKVKVKVKVKKRGSREIGLFARPGAREFLSRVLTALYTVRMAQN